MKFDLQRLKGERVARGITQAEMAHKIGISTNAYWRKENGERDIGMEEFVKIHLLNRYRAQFNFSPLNSSRFFIFDYCCFYVI